jgi:hypothetical protein
MNPVAWADTINKRMRTACPGWNTLATVQDVQVSPNDPFDPQNYVIDVRFWHDSFGTRRQISVHLLESTAKPLDVIDAVIAECKRDVERAESNASPQSPSAPSS